MRSQSSSVSLSFIIVISALLALIILAVYVSDTDAASTKKKKATPDDGQPNKKKDFKKLSDFDIDRMVREAEEKEDDESMDDEMRAKKRRDDEIKRRASAGESTADLYPPDKQPTNPLVLVKLATNNLKETERIAAFVSRDFLRVQLGFDLKAYTTSDSSFVIFAQNTESAFIRELLLKEKLPNVPIVYLVHAGKRYYPDGRTLDNNEEEKREKEEEERRKKQKEL